MAQTQTPPAERASLELDRAARWLRGNAVVLAGLLLIAAQLWWKAGLLDRSFFRLDDYYFLERAASSGLTWKYLMWIDGGKLTPLGFALSWVLVRISPVDWALTSAVTLILLAAACLALLRMLRTLFGSRPAILIPLLVYLVSPLTFSGVVWWAVTLELLPLQLALFCAVTAHVHYLRTGRLRHAAAAAGWLLAGMASSLRGAAVPLLLFAVTSGFVSAGLGGDGPPQAPPVHAGLGGDDPLQTPSVQGSWARAAWTALREHWRVWSAYAALMAGYGVIYLVQLGTSSAQPRRPGSFGGVFTFAGTLLRDTFLPGVLGGPWRWLGTGAEAAANPPATLVRICWVLAAAVVAASIWHRPRAWRAWAILLGWLIVVDVIPVMLGRAAIVPGALLGMVTRYVWDAVAVLALCLGLAFLPQQGEPAFRTVSQPGWRLRAATASLLTVLVIGSVWSLRAYSADPTAAQGRSYVATARIALADAPAGTVIVNDPVPQYVMGGFYGPVSDAANVLGPMRSGPAGERPGFVTRPDGTFDRLRLFDGWGRLAPAVVVGVPSQSLAGNKCWPASNDVVAVRLRSTARGQGFLRLDYLAGARAQVFVSFAGHPRLYTVLPGLHSAYFPVHGSASMVIVQGLTGRLPCVGDAEIGALLPSGAGSAIPPLAVAG